VLLLVTLVDAVPVALAGDHLPLVPVIQPAIYFKIAVKMFHHLANQVCIMQNI
jgi:hypothetical protein